MTIQKELLNLLACPKCGASLAQKEDQLFCAVCQLSYPIRDGMPILLNDEAIKQ